MNISKSVRHITIAAILVFSAVISITSPDEHAAADIGPAPIYAQGGILDSATASTNVAMDYESVTLTYGQPVENPGLYPEGYMPVHVAADFRMKNTSSTNETMNVYFPISDDLYVGGYNEDGITNFKVNGQLLSANSTTAIPTTINGKTQSMPVYEWPQSFPANSTTNIKIEYDSRSAKEQGVYYLTYVLGTGRGWKGSITSGEIKFVLPETLASYSVVDDAPKIDANKIPYKVSGNSIIVTLSNYEPGSDDVIALGVYDPNVVSQIEQLKKQSSTYTNTLSIAKLFRGLSIGPHCVFCIEPAAQQAENYYISALNKSTSENELNTVLLSYTYGDSYQNPSLQKILDFLALATDKECDLEEFQCTNVEKDSLLMDMRETGIIGGANNKYTKQFLTQYSCSIRAYNKNLSTTVDNFLGSPSDCTTKQDNTTTHKAKTESTKQHNKKYLIIGGLAGLAALIAAIVTFIVIRKKKQQKTSNDNKKHEE